MLIEESLQEQIVRLAIIQYLIWSRELPEDFSHEAIEASACYYFLEIPFSQKISRFTIGVMQALVRRLAKGFNLPEGIAELKLLEKSFRLELDGEVFPVSAAEAINQRLAKNGSRLRLCSGYYGVHKFFLLGEASERTSQGKRVYRFREEVAVTPGCHLLMAAITDGHNIFLREASARFLFFQKWQPALAEKGLRRITLEKFGLNSEKDFADREKTKAFLTAFQENLFLHEQNHTSVFEHLPEEELVALAEASKVLGQNVLVHLLELFSDWISGKESPSPLAKIAQERDFSRLFLYLSDNWFYDAGMPEQESFSSLSLSPIIRHFKEGKVDWEGLTKEISDRQNGSLLNLYRQSFSEIVKEVKAIIEKAEYTLVAQPINYRTMAAYLENMIKQKNQGISAKEYWITYYSNLFVYLKKFSPESYRQLVEYLQKAQVKLEGEVSQRLGGKEQRLKNKLEQKMRRLEKCFCLN